MTRWILLSLLVFAGHVLAGCDGKPAASSPPPPPAVTVSRPIQKNIVEWDDFVGRFEAMDDVAIRSRVTGYLEQVHFQDGAIVQTSGTVTPTNGELGSETNTSGAVLAIKLDNGQIRS